MSVKLVLGNFLNFFSTVDIIFFIYVPNIMASCTSVKSAGFSYNTRILTQKSYENISKTSRTSL